MALMSFAVIPQLEVQQRHHKMLMKVDMMKLHLTFNYILANFVTTFNMPSNKKGYNILGRNL